MKLAAGRHWNWIKKGRADGQTNWPAGWLAGWRLVRQLSAKANSQSLPNLRRTFARSPLALLQPVSFGMQIRSGRNNDDDDTEEEEALQAFVHTFASAFPLAGPPACLLVCSLVCSLANHSAACKAADRRAAFAARWERVLCRSPWLARLYSSAAAAAAAASVSPARSRRRAKLARPTNSLTNLQSSAQTLQQLVGKDSPARFLRPIFAQPRPMIALLD